MRFGGAIVVAGAALALIGASAPERSAHWVATWGSAQMALLPKDALPKVESSSGVIVRQTVRVSLGGAMVRVRFSNAFGTDPLTIDDASISSKGQTQALRFAKHTAVEIPAGAEIYSDPVTLAVVAGGDLVISLHLPVPPERGTGHPGARATTFVAPGERLSAPSAGAVSVPRWFALADVEVQSAPNAAVVVAIGDSITDGSGVQPDTNARWTDVFAARLRASTALRHWGVVNAGIGGNRVTLDGLGPNLLARFDRDVIARSGVKAAILLEGVNDLGMLTRDKPVPPAEHTALVHRITSGYTEVVRRAHAHGIRVMGGTIMPFGGSAYYHPDAANEADRQAVNAFIRSSGTFDAVIDFDAAMRDPARPDRLAPAFDSGDHLHPSIAGYRAMAQAVPLTLFGKPAS